MAAVAVSMAADPEASMAVVDSVAVVADLVAVGSFVAAASEAARDLLAEEVTPGAEGPKPAAISDRWEIVRRIFLPPSAMAGGIRSAPPAEPPVQHRASLGVVMVGEAAGAVATVGAVAGVGAAGVGASDGRTGDLDGDSAGILGYTIPFGMPPRRHTIPTIRIMGWIMTGPTIRRPTGLISATLTRKESFRNTPSLTYDHVSRGVSL